MSIKEKLEKYEFLLENAPCILDMNNRRVLLNKEAPNPNELASFEDYNSYWEEARNLTQKLKVESYGDWEMSVAVVNTKHFENRQTLDRLFLAQFGIEAEPKQFGRVSIRDAISMCRVEIGCEMDFYLQHETEIEKDLNRKVDICSINDNIEKVKSLEEELFYNQMCRLFGDDVDDFLEDDEDEKLKKVCTVKEFAILFLDGNCVYATGRRGDFYLLFTYLY